MSAESVRREAEEVKGRGRKRQRQAVVDCGQFRCLGFQGADGKWRDGRGNELPQVVRVVSEL